MALGMWQRNGLFMEIALHPQVQSMALGMWQRNISSWRLVVFSWFSLTYRKVPKFSDARKLRCNLPKIQTNRPNLSVFRQKDTDGIANSEDPDQTAPLGAV